MQAKIRLVHRSINYHVVHTINPYIHVIELANTDDEMKLDTLPYGLTPNPIYEGPVYDTVKEPFKTLQPLPPPTRPPTAGSMYTETPSHTKLRGSDYEELTPHYKGGVEDCYVHMQSYNKQ